MGVCITKPGSEISLLPAKYIIRYSFECVSSSDMSPVTWPITWPAGVVQGMITGIRGLCNGLGPALYGFIFFLFNVELNTMDPIQGDFNIDPLPLHSPTEVPYRSILKGPQPLFCINACNSSGLHQTNFTRVWICVITSQNQTLYQTPVKVHVVSPCLLVLVSWPALPDYDLTMTKSKTSMECLKPSFRQEVLKNIKIFVQVNFTKGGVKLWLSNDTGFTLKPFYCVVLLSMLASLLTSCSKPFVWLLW